MPFIYPVFAAEDNEMVQLIMTHKGAIRVTLAKLLGFPPADVALKSQPISPQQMLLCDNVDRLEFIIDTGNRTVLLTDSDMEKMGRAFIAECPFMENVEFGIWVRVMTQNGYWKQRTSGELDERFLRHLERGEHLTDRFLQEMKDA